MRKRTVMIYIFLLSCCFNMLVAQSEIDPPQLEIESESISEGDFEQFKKELTTKFPGDALIDSNGYIPALGLYFLHECDETCETFLYEKDPNDNIALPCSYDQGILGFILSPSGTQLITWSSYDGPDYDYSYYYRAEIFVYDFRPGKGLEGIAMKAHFITHDWSIEELIWVEDEQVALKIYRGQKSLAGVEGGYEYVVADLKIDSKKE